MAGGDRAVVESLFSAIADGDRESALRVVHPAVVWTPTVWSGSATLRGRGAVRAWFDQFGPALADLRVHAGNILQEDGWVVALGTVHDSRGGGSFVTRVGWTFAVEDAMVIEGRAYGTWEEAREAGGLAGGTPDQNDEERIEG